MSRSRTRLISFPIEGENKKENKCNNAREFVFHKLIFVRKITNFHVGNEDLRNNFSTNKMVR